MPGGVRDVPGLWEFLSEKKDVHMEFNEPRFSAKGFYHPNSDRPGTAVASHGFLLAEDPLLFDPAFFGITDAEVESLDAAQRKLLECTYEAFENAAETWDSVSGSRTGVFVGDICFDNYLTQTRDWDYSTKYSATGSFPNMLANRLHYVFNLKGPSLLVNSACTSAMYALHLAITSMRNGDCDSAIVAGSNWIMDPMCHIAMGKLGALSATSRSHTFDESADGYARGEGFAALYLKTPARAIQDASPIRALVMGTAINANGRTKGITNPSGPAQETVIREAYRNAGVKRRYSSATELARVSAALEDRLVIGSVKTNMGHLGGACALPGILKVVAALEAGEIPPTLGYKTANPCIDLEKAKARVNTEVEPWPKNRLKRASVTSAGFGGTNGHCVIDHVHNAIPLYVKPGIVGHRVEELSGTNGYVSNGTNGHDTNGINGHVTNGANGHSPNGINGHEVKRVNGHSTNGINGNGAKAAEQQPRHGPVLNTPNMIRKADAGTHQFVVLPFSAHNQVSLKANMDALSQAIDRHSIADVAYTLAAKRSRFIQRAFCIVDKDQVAQTELGQDVKVYTSPQPVRVGFAFTGEGAQWHAMGAGLFEYAVFRNTIAYLDRILARFTHPASWKIADVLSGRCEKDLVQTPAVSQTVCTALQIGLVDLLASWSIRSTGVVGHSSGEMAAAYAVGRITAAEGITAAYYRGYLVSLNRKKGAMLAVGIGPDQGADYIQEAGLEEKVRIAAINSPDSVTMSGDAEAVEELSAKLSEKAVFNRVLQTGGLAYHSHHMLPLGHAYAEAVDDGKRSLEKDAIYDESQKYPLIPWFSSVTPNKDLLGQRMPTSYWRSNLESPVRFSEALSKLLDSPDLGIGGVIEIGPHPALKSPVAQIVKTLGKSIPHLASLKRAEDGQKSLLGLAGTLFAMNSNVDLVAVNAVDEHTGGELAHGSTAIDLPPYQYTYGPILYHEGRASKEYRLRKIPWHDLLGSKIAGTTRLRPQWRNMLRLKDLPWLNDHRVPPHVLHPGAAHIVMAMLAAEQAYNEFSDALPITGIALRNVSIKKTLVVPEDDHGIEIVLSMELEDGATAKSPGWATFSISSVVRDTDQWTEHCSGLAKAEVASFEQVDPATIPLIYMTAVYAFEHVTRLRKGQKVLIQSASGGLGLAAIQLARAKGAEIFVTAGNAEKTSFLTEKMGIPFDHIFSSRDSTDVSRMIRATENDGFDVILSNSQGQMLYESIKALAPLGHLIDVGRLDVTSSRNLALELFQKSASFTSFDLGLVIERDADFGGELMKSVDEHHSAGRIGPIGPFTASHISQLGPTLLRFSKGTHIGKMVVSYQDPGCIIRKHKAVTPIQFDPEARYILIGGLSNLGRSLVRFMSDRGARHLVVWSRSGPNNLSPEANALIDELAIKGVHVQAIACDVSNQEQVMRAVQDANSDRTVRGVLHFAVSYQDISFDKMTAKMFYEGMAAKVLGAKNLHEATVSLPLDFFSMISSFGTVYAFPTQSIYLAANNFLDYFARYRRRCGLPASTVSLGFISDLGALTQDAVTVSLFARTKGQTVTGSQVLRMLEPIFLNHSDHEDKHQQWLGYSQDPLSEANIVTGIDPAVLALMKREETKVSKTTSSSSSIPRWYRDARVSVMLRALDDAWRYQAGDAAKDMQDVDNGADKSPNAQLRRRFQVSIANIRKQESGEKTVEYPETVAFVTDAIRATVAGMLFTDPSAINVANTVADHGIDRLLAAEFRSWLHAVFGQNISMLDLLDARTNINVLSERIVDEAATS